MYIIFVGSKGAGYFIDEEVKRLKGEIEFVESKAHISEQINTKKICGSREVSFTTCKKRLHCNYI